MWQVRREHGPQAVADEVVGVKGVDTMEVAELVVSIHLSRNTLMRMRTSQLQRNQRTRVLVTCMSMVSGHHNTSLTLMLGLPTPLAMRTHCHRNVRPDDSQQHISHTHASPQSLLPTQLSPSLFTESTHKGGCIFVPTPSRYCCNKSSHFKHIRQIIYANKRQG